MEKKLRSLLQELHDELEQADDQVEPASRDLLRDVMNDIHAVLARPAGEAPESDDSLNDRVREAMVDFETSHPKLSFTLERLVDALAAMGI